MQKGTVKWFNPTKGLWVHQADGRRMEWSSISRRSSRWALNTQRKIGVELNLVENRGELAKPQDLLNFVTIREES